MSSYKDLQISFRVTSDLLIANHMKAPLAKIMFNNVLLFKKHRIASFDITEFAQLVEDEALGVADSEKMLGVKQLKILRSALVAFYSATDKVGHDTIREY